MNKKRIIISLLHINSQNTIKSLLGQTQLADTIYVHTPDTFINKSTDTSTNTSTDLFDSNIIKTIPCRDYNDLTALSTILPIESNPETVILFLSKTVSINNSSLHNKFVEQMVESCRMNDSIMVSVVNRDAYNGVELTDNIFNECVAYICKRRYFDSNNNAMSVLNNTHNNKELVQYFASNNVKIQLTKFDNPLFNPSNHPSPIHCLIQATIHRLIHCLIQATIHRPIHRYLPELRPIRGP